MLKLYEWLFHAKKIVKKKLLEKDIVLVFIAWWSASWKTSQVAKRLDYYYKDDSIILSMDNYYRWKDYVEKNNITFDQPEAIDIELFHKHLKILLNWKEVMIPNYDFINSKPIYDSIKIIPKKLIIVEGLFTLNESFNDISDLKIFVETSVNWRLIRRILRDVKRTWQKVEEIIEIFEKVVNPMHEIYIEPQKNIADLIILNEFNSYFELSRDLDLEKFKKQHNIPLL